MVLLLYEWLLHGQLLASAYEVTASIWRPHEAMAAYMPWMLLGQLLFAFVFCWLFTMTKCQTTPKDGACYGLVIGLLMSSVSLVYYSVLPITLSLLAWWLIGGILETVIAGIVFAKIYARS